MMTQLEIQAVRRTPVAMALMVACQVEASTLQLRWDPSSSQVSGYRLHYGRSSGHQDAIVDVGNQTSDTLKGLDSGQRYYFRITAYDHVGNESDFGSELTAITSSHGTSVASEMMDGWQGGGSINGLQTGSEGPALATSDADTSEGNRQEQSHPSGELAISGGGPSQGEALPRLVSAQLEIGAVPVDQEWRRVELRKPLDSPVVIARGVGSQRSDPVVV